MIYLDNASTTYVYPECVYDIQDKLVNYWGNPSNIYTWGNKSQYVITHSKETIADCIGARPEEIFFTSGASEGNAWALRQRYKIYCSPFEHHNYLDALNTEVLKDENVLSFKDFGEDTGYAHMLVSNETGQYFDKVYEYFDYVKSMGGFTICDCTQAYGNFAIDMAKLHCDMAVFSGHKFHAPKGIGFVYIRKEAQSRINPIIYGTQQQGLRGGTENVPYISALAIAAEKSKDWRQKQFYCASLFSEAIFALQVLPKEDVLHTWDLLPNFSETTFHFCLRNVESELIQSILSIEQDIFIGIGSGCSDGSMEANPTLKALGIPEDFIHGPIRLSFTEKNTRQEVRRAIEAIIDVYQRVRQK